MTKNMFPRQDPYLWDNRYAAIKELAKELAKTVAQKGPSAANQSMLQQIQELQRENARLKSEKSQGSRSVIPASPAHTPPPKGVRTPKGSAASGLTPRTNQGSQASGGQPTPPSYRRPKDRQNSAEATDGPVRSLEDFWTARSAEAVPEEFELNEEHEGNDDLATLAGSPEFRPEDDEEAEPVDPLDTVQQFERTTQTRFLEECKLDNYRVNTVNNWVSQKVGKEKMAQVYRSNLNAPWVGVMLSKLRLHEKKFPIFGTKVGRGKQLTQLVFNYRIFMRQFDCGRPCDVLAALTNWCKRWKQPSDVIKHMSNWAWYWDLQIIFHIRFSNGTGTIIQHLQREFEDKHPELQCYKWAFQWGTEVFRTQGQFFLSYSAVFDHADPFSSRYIQQFEQDDPVMIQQDLIGFFNSVDHKAGTKDLRIFRGHRRFRGSTTKVLHIKHVMQLTKFELQSAYFKVGMDTFCQIQGACMGSPLAPVLCAMVAAEQEFLTIRSLRTQLDDAGLLRIFRYADNRCFFLRRAECHTDWACLFLRLDFYGLPIELELVPGEELLGSTTSVTQGTITMRQPINETVLRSTRSAGDRSAAFSGFQARALSIKRHARPIRLIRPQVEDLIEIYRRRGFGLQELFKLASKFRA
ncbi:unnamed protein product [Symbiodinium sp. KB8]|nr:unnamed protein product [Symbiodinium sp. KB8]